MPELGDFFEVVNVAVTTYPLFYVVCHEGEREVLMSGAGAPSDSTHCNSLHCEHLHFRMFAHTWYMLPGRTVTIDGVGRLGQYRDTDCFGFD